MSEGGGRTVGTSRSPRGNPAVITWCHASQRTPRTSPYEGTGAHLRDRLAPPSGTGMSRRAHVAAGLAIALLSGPWEPAALRRRAATALGRSRRQRVDARPRDGRPRRLPPATGRPAARAGRLPDDDGRLGTRAGRPCRGRAPSGRRRCRRRWCGTPPGFPSSPTSRRWPGCSTSTRASSPGSPTTAVSSAVPASGCATTPGASWRVRAASACSPPPPAAQGDPAPAAAARARTAARAPGRARVRSGSVGAHRGGPARRSRGGAADGPGHLLPRHPGATGLGAAPVGGRPAGAGRVRRHRPGDDGGAGLAVPPATRAGGRRTCRRARRRPRRWPTSSASGSTAGWPRSPSGTAPPTPATSTTSPSAAPGSCAASGSPGRSPRSWPARASR